jgi:hypothetical protein
MHARRSLHNYTMHSSTTPPAQIGVPSAPPPPGPSSYAQYYDQDKEGWFYRGAVRLAGEAAAAHGVADGALVKASALAEAGPAGPGPGPGAGAVLDASGLAADIAAAAAGAAAGGGGAVAAAAGGAHPFSGGGSAPGGYERAAAKSEADAKGAVAGVKRETESGEPEGKRARAQ